MGVGACSENGLSRWRCSGDADLWIRSRYGRRRLFAPLLLIFPLVAMVPFVPVRYVRQEDASIWVIPFDMARRMTLRPCELSEATAFIREHHRHHRPPVGHRFSLKAVSEGLTVGVVVVGRPVARHQQDGETLEITRLCTDGTRNACSFLVGAVKRAGRALGYKRLISYTLESEPGSSWLSSGMDQTATLKGAAWKHTGTDVAPLFGINRNNDHPLVNKRRWEIRL